MNVRKTVTRFLGILGASALMLSATVLPAEASKLSAASDCPANWFCIFDNTGFTGRMLKFQNGDNLDAYGFRDRAESYVNNTGYSVKLTDVKSLRPDDNLTVAARSRSSDLGSWKNRIDRVTVNR